MYKNNKLILLNKEKCINCGICTGVCNAKALYLNRENWQVQFLEEACVLCLECTIACPVNAINVNTINVLEKKVKE